MIHVIARNFVKPEKITEFRELALELEQATLLETGCIEYELYQSVSDPEKFTFVEFWETQKNLDDHMNSPHFLRICPKLAELTKQDGDVSIITC